MTDYTEAAAALLAIHNDEIRKQAGENSDSEQAETT